MPEYGTIGLLIMAISGLVSAIVWLETGRVKDFRRTIDYYREKTITVLTSNTDTTERLMMEVRDLREQIRELRRDLRDFKKERE